MVEDIFTKYKIDTNKALAYHTQVYQAIDEIITNSLKPGDQLPGEPKLCILFGVSRTVIRQALDQLTNDGRIIRIMGKGTFVAEPKIHEGLISHLTGFYEDMIKQGYRPESKVLKQHRISASVKVARNLQIEVGDPVIELKRLRFANNVPIQIVTSYLPYALCAMVLQADFSHQSLYSYLIDVCQINIACGKRIIEAVLATNEEAKLLNIISGAPLILLDSITYMENGIPFEYYNAVHRSDRARFEVNLIRAK